jgi:outer membrane protein assembly factor BamB
VWGIAASLDQGRNSYASAAVAPDGTLYIPSFFKLYAVHPAGIEKWSLIPNGTMPDSSPAMGTDGTISISSEISALDTGHFYAINRDPR